MVKLQKYDLLQNTGRNAKNLPYFLVLQSEQSLGRELVIVAPVYVAATFGPNIEKLHVNFALHQEQLVLALEEMGAVFTRSLGHKVGNIGDIDYEIGKGLDFLLKGI